MEVSVSDMSKNNYFCYLLLLTPMVRTHSRAWATLR